MSQLADHLTSASVKRLHDEFTAGLDILQGLDRKYVGFNRRAFETVGEPMLRWIHHQLISSSTAAKGPFEGFQYRANRSISSVIQEELDKAGLTTTPVQSMVADVSRILKANGLIKYEKRSTIWLRPWIGNLKYVSAGFDTDPKTEQRIAEEADKPVSARIDLRSIKTPDPTPEAVLDFIGRFVPAALKVQESEVAARQRILELEVQLAEIQERLEEATKASEAGAWTEVTTQLNGLLNKPVSEGGDRDEPDQG